MSELWLGIDGALGAFSAALVASDGSMPPRVGAASGNDALERGLTIVDEVLAGVAFAELHAIAVGTGPGGFTGLRIALSYAKSLAFAAQRPLAGVSSYDAVSPPGIADTHAAFVHGRTGIACARLRIRVAGDSAGSVILTDAGPVHWQERIVCGTYAAIAEALAEQLPSGFVLRSFGAAEGAAPALGERGITVLAVAPHPICPALAIARRALASNAPLAGSAHALRADYGEAHYAERSVAREVTP